MLLFYFLCFCNYFYAVSYTHLDVYKRQLVYKTNVKGIWAYGLRYWEPSSTYRQGSKISEQSCKTLRIRQGMHRIQRDRVVKEVIKRASVKRNEGIGVHLNKLVDNLMDAHNWRGLNRLNYQQDSLYVSD